MTPQPRDQDTPEQGRVTGLPALEKLWWAQGWLELGLPPLQHKHLDKEQQLLLTSFLVQKKKINNFLKKSYIKCNSNSMGHLEDPIPLTHPKYFTALSQEKKKEMLVWNPFRGLSHILQSALTRSKSVAFEGRRQITLKAYLGQYFGT